MCLSKSLTTGDVTKFAQDVATNGRGPGPDYAIMEIIREVGCTDFASNTIAKIAEWIFSETNTEELEFMAIRLNAVIAVRHMNEALK